jgi:EAL domain-containing protein (putative c-di-GMP-specific phosphodiesterase class I)
MTGLADRPRARPPARLLKRSIMASRFRAAAAQGRIELHYQPIVEQRSGRTVAAEALARWRHPRHGLVPPVAFLPYLEGTWAETTLNRLVLDGATRQAADWAAGGHPVQVTVNISPPCLDSKLRDSIAIALERTGLAPSLLHVELTERGDAYEESAAYAEALDSVRRLGVTISLDDFGRARSSLMRLTTLPVDALKIDRGFIAASEDAKNAEVLRNAIGLAHTLGLRVVVEGVESDAQWHRMDGWGADFAQGYLLSPALPGEQLIGWIEGEREQLVARLKLATAFIERRTGFNDRRSILDRRGDGRAFYGGIASRRRHGGELTRRPA